MPVHPPRPGALDFAAALDRARGAAGNVPLALVNERTDKLVADVVELAVTRRSRRKGLLGREGLPSSSGMVLAPCFSIHTAFMRFPIDVLFVARDGRAVRIAHAVRPWRAVASARAYAAIEFSAGVLEQRDVVVGDRIRLC